MSVVTSALGSVLGYLGAEVAGEVLFQRLLWPQRFYNNLQPTDFLKLALLFPTCGPLHRAALNVLDKFRDNGLYKGKQRGDMLDTAFFSSISEARYFHRTAPTADGRQREHKVRNGLWVESIRHIEQAIAFRQPCGGSEAVSGDVENGHQRKARALQSIYRLHLQFKSPEQLEQEDAIIVREDKATFWTVAGIFSTEISSVLIAVAGVLLYHFTNGDVPASDLWIIGFFCIPLLLKLAALAFSVRREELKLELPGRDSAEANATRLVPHSGTRLEKRTGSVTTEESTKRIRDKPRDDGEILEIVCPSAGFILISMDSPITEPSLQFFKHYGHPIRSSHYDRVRELAGIGLAYCFVLYFPIGLLLLSWMSEPIQYLWLGQQIYCVLAMHIIRLLGWEGCGRTQEAIAKVLSQKGAVCLQGQHGYVKATLEVEEAKSVGLAKERVKDIILGNSNFRASYIQP